MEELLGGGKGAEGWETPPSREKF